MTETLNRTPLYDLHVELGAKMVPFAGYEMPVQYDGVMGEHNHTREAAGLFDVSHMGQAILRGADVAASLKYEVGDPIIVAHGLASFTEHKDQPFQVSGILKKTGTPVDRTVIVSLRAIEAIHVDWQGGSQIQGQKTPIDAIRKMELQPKAVTAALVGIENRLKVFSLQRAINNYPREPLLAILPGVALQELWQIIGIAEVALISVSAMVVVTALLVMMAMIFSSLNERRREMAIFRAMGARPLAIFGILIFEASMIAISGAILGFALAYIGLYFARPIVDSAFGLWLPSAAPTLNEFLLLAAVVAASIIVSLLPAIRAYRLSLSDGMTVQI